MKEPNSAAKKRPGGKPFYIDPNCSYCGTALRYTFKVERTKPKYKWYDEFSCPNPECEANPQVRYPEYGIFLDHPLKPSVWALFEIKLV